MIVETVLYKLTDLLEKIVHLLDHIKTVHHFISRLQANVIIRELWLAFSLGNHKKWYIVIPHTLNAK